MISNSVSYKRVLLKLSGEMLLGEQKFGISYAACRSIALAVKEMRQSGIEVAIVIGGGNIFRGMSLKETGISRTPADHIGMLATLMNGVALQQAFLSIDCKAQVMSALECPAVAESYNWSKALDALNAGNVLIFVGGTGNPYFTTDSAAALRASEIKADILLKATKVDGIYNKDPLKFPDAIKYDFISHSRMLAEKLEVMDATAVALCRSNKIPIFVFNMNMIGKFPLANVLLKNEQGTLVSDKGE